MACGPCGKARHSSKLALRAAMKGNIREGAIRAKEAAAHIGAKIRGHDAEATSQEPSATTGSGEASPRLR